MIERVDLEGVRDAGERLAAAADAEQPAAEFLEHQDIVGLDQGPRIPFESAYAVEAFSMVVFISEA